MRAAAQIRQFGLGLAPAACMLVLWHAAWLLWLQVPAGRVPPPAARGMPQIRFVEPSASASSSMWQPHLIALPWEVGLARGVSDPRDGYGLAPGIRVPMPEATGAVAAAAPAPLPVGIALTGAVCGAQAYLPQRYAAPDAPLVYGAAASPRSVTLSAALHRAGFALPEPPADALPAADRPWLLSAFVQTGPDGRPCAVFIETPSGIADIDREVARWLFRGAARPGAPPAAGSVSVAGRPADKRAEDAK